MTNTVGSPRTVCLPWDDPPLPFPPAFELCEEENGFFLDPRNFSRACCRAHALQRSAFVLGQYLLREQTMCNIRLRKT